MILGDPEKISSPFFLLVPGWGRWPLVVLATVATVIASQAVITGAFSVASQAIQLGYLPRLRITHTSEETIGQIYVPWINWLLMISVRTLVVTFKSSAYLLFLGGELHQARARRVAAAADRHHRVHDLDHLATRPRMIVSRLPASEEGSLREFVGDLHHQQPPVVRVPGTAVFLNRGRDDGAAGDACDRLASAHRERLCDLGEGFGKRPVLPVLVERSMCVVDQKPCQRNAAGADHLPPAQPVGQRLDLVALA